MPTAEQVTTIRGLSAYEYHETPNIESAESYVNSIHLETNRKPDNYFFWIDELGMIDPKTNKYVHDLVSPESHHNPYLGLVEFSIIHQLDAWSKKPDSRLSVWFSPELKKEGEYPANKIVVHEISKSPAGQKIINNTMIIFDCTRDECLEIAKKLFPSELTAVISVEELRSMIINNKNELSIAEIIEAISPYTPTNKNYKPMDIETRRYLGQLIVDRMPSDYVAREMARLGIIGEYSLVCAGGGSYSDLINSNSSAFGFLDGAVKYVRNCGVCGTPINAHISSGYQCRVCNQIYLGC